MKQCNCVSQSALRQSCISEKVLVIKSWSMKEGRKKITKKELLVQ